MLIDLWSIILFLVFCIFSYWVGKSLFKYGFKIIFDFYPKDYSKTNNRRYYTNTSKNLYNTKNTRPASKDYKRCPQCGAKCAKTDDFCMRCGYHF